MTFYPCLEEEQHRPAVLGAELFLEVAQQLHAPLQEILRLCLYNSDSSPPVSPGSMSFR